MKVYKMGVFSGKYKYSLDEKGRINFKKILKRILPEDHEDTKREKFNVFHLYKDYVKKPGSDEKYPVFYVFTDEEWVLFYEQLEISLSDDELSLFTTLKCDEASLDGMSRMTFPKEFLKYIKASKNLFIQGFGGNRLQVWSEEVFEIYSKEITAQTEEPDFHGILNRSKKKDH